MWLVSKDESPAAMWGSFIKLGSMKRKDAKPGERKYIDGRFKDGVDTGRFSSNKVPLPLKPMSPVSTKMAEMLDSIPDWVNDIPKQVIRQQEASRHFKNKKNKHT